MIKITKIESLGGFCLRAWFNNGAVGEYDFSTLVTETGVMVEPLRNADFFARGFIEDGALIWPNGFDIAPNWLHDEMNLTSALRKPEPV